MGDIQGHVRGILTAIGEDPERDGLKRTPERVEKAMAFLTEGYRQRIEDVVGGALFREDHHNMVVVRDIEFYSMCEHHMLPFFGKAHVAYLPDCTILGLSKMARVVDVFARRLQVQERMTDQIANALMEVLKPQGVGVVLEASHFCMMMRGVEKQGSSTVTSAMRGVFLDDHRTREDPAPGGCLAMMRVTMLGTSAAVPTVERGVAALMIQRDGESLLFDCGEGTQRQMMRYGAGFAVDDLFITHYHADHTLGVPGLLRTMGLQGRTAPLRLYGPPGAERHLGALVTLGMERDKFPVEIIEVRPGDALARDGYQILVGEAVHKGSCVAYALAESDRLGRFDPAIAVRLGVPEGPLWGRMHRGESVTLEDGRVVTPADLVGPPRPGRRVVYSGDTKPCAGVTQLARGADLLIHEATFGEDEAGRARETLHSTAKGAATVARDAGVRQLVLTHLSARYSREAPELVTEARIIFEQTYIARDGLVIEIPYLD